MAMTLTALLSIMLVTLGLVLLALLDLVRATEMDMGARAIVAAALIFVAPIGLLLWLFVRGGRTGAVVGAGLLALAATGLVAVAVGSNHSVEMVQTSSVGGSFSAGQPIP